MQVQLALHFGFQLWRLRAKGDALQKRMDGRAAFRPGHAGLLQKGRAAQGQFLFGVGHGADTDFNRDGFQRFVGALPCKRFQQAFGQGIVRQGGASGSAACTAGGGSSRRMFSGASVGI